LPTRMTLLTDAMVLPGLEVRSKRPIVPQGPAGRPLRQGACQNLPA